MYPIGVSELTVDLDTVAVVLHEALQTLVDVRWTTLIKQMKAVDSAENNLEVCLNMASSLIIRHPSIIHEEEEELCMD